MIESITNHLRESKINRNEYGYTRELLVRQRIINYNILRFTKDLILQGGSVLDGCAGPEGSFQAATLFGYNWIGNDISIQFTNNLKRFGANKVIISDFTQSPFKADTVDAIFLIFGLNNIFNTKGATSEAERILKKNGLFVVADPGPTMKVVDIILYSLLTSLKSDPKASTLLENKRFSENVHSYFETQSFTNDEYVDLFVKNHLGGKKAELFQELKRLLPQLKEVKKIEFKFQDHIILKYLETTIQESKQRGFKIAKLGVIVAGQKQTGEWLVSEACSLQEDTFLDEIMKVRIWKSKVNQYMKEEIYHCPRRLFVPILCFKK